MRHQQKSSLVLHISLWIVQILLAASLLWAACMKLFQPIAILSAMWPWAGEVSPAFVKFTGLMDLLGGLGLLLPALLRIQPKLTPIAAAGIFVLMLCAGTFHIMRGEVSSTGINIAFALLAAFVAWGRWFKAPIAARSVDAFAVRH